MDISFIDTLFVPIIVAFCLCIGYVLKGFDKIPNEWIPAILLVLGAVSGFIKFGLDYDGITMGMVSGLASVGLHQVFHQRIKAKFGEEEMVTMGIGEWEDEDEVYDEDTFDLVDEVEETEEAEEVVVDEAVDEE